MARNAEKAMTTLARWRAAHLEQDGEKTKVRRPYLASECTDLKQAEKWRMQIIREIARKVSQIQNAGLGEFRIRDLNDEINKLMREKGHWEVQIRDLGGPDYAAIGPRMLDNEGKEVPGNRGYKYFGAARQLPGVRELFEQAVPAAPRKTRGELMKCIDAYYYGYRDDDDNILIPLESVAEEQAMEKALAQWKMKKEIGEEDGDKEDELYIDPDDEQMQENPSKPACVQSDVNEPEYLRRDKFIAYVPVPSQKDIEKALLDRRKAELLDRLGLFDLGEDTAMEQQAESDNEQSAADVKDSDDKDVPHTNNENKTNMEVETPESNQLSSTQDGT